MGALTIRNIDDELVAAIERRAGERDISMEEEVRRLLAASYPQDVRGGAEDQDRQRDALRKRLNDSIARGGFVTDEDLDAALARKSAALAKDGL